MLVFGGKESIYPFEQNDKKKYTSTSTIYYKHIRLSLFSTWGVVWLMKTRLKYYLIASKSGYSSFKTNYVKLK